MGGASNPSINSANRQKMATAWSVQDGIHALFSRIADCTEYAKFAGSPISDHDKKEAALACLRHRQAFNQAYLDWKLEANQTYPHLNLFFEQQDLNRREVASKAGEFGFGGNVQEEDSP